MILITRSDPSVLTWKQTGYKSQNNQHWNLYSQDTQQMVPNYHRPTNLQDRSETQEEIITEAYCLILSTSMPEQPNYNQDCLVSLMNSETPIWKSSLITIVAQPHFVNQIKPWPSIYAWYAKCADTLKSTLVVIRLMNSPTSYPDIDIDEASRNTPA